jgi:CubicO group peptidase (beta-lactamase class C family)
MRKLTILILLLVSGLRLQAADDPANPFDLAETLRPLAEKHKLPGVVGAIVHGDQIVALGSTGVRKLGDPAPFLTTDMIHLGSDTKAMTAILIGQLIDQKKLTLQSTMEELFPDLAGRMNEKMAKVTVQNLLTHTAGLPHDLLWGLVAMTKGSMMEQRRLAVTTALTAEPATPIGKYSYSNAGFVILGAIVESKTGEPWEKVIQEKIFDPLHMTSAGFGIPGTIGKVDQPWGHVMQGLKLVPVQIDNLPVMAPAGEVHCSMVDWAKFIGETLRSAEGHPTLVSLETFRSLSRPLPGQDYAGGWAVVKRGWAGGIAFSHTGSNTTWYCDVWIAPKKNFACLIATNSGTDEAGEATDEGIGLLIDVNQKLAGGH